MPCRYSSSVSRSRALSWLLPALLLIVPVAGRAGWSEGFGAPGTDGEVRCFAEFEGDLVAGGAFSIAGDAFCRNVAAWDGAAWRSLGEGLPFPTRTMIVWDGQLLAGQNVQVGNSWRSSLAGWDGAQWRAWAGEFNGRILTLAIHGGELHAAGEFTAIDGVPAARIVRWDGAQWQPCGDGIGDGAVAALATYGGQLVAGGSFTQADGLAARHVARWNGAAWDSVGVGLAAAVEDFEVLDGRLLATAGSELAAWDGAAWTCVHQGYHEVPDNCLPCPYEGEVCHRLQVHEGQLCMSVFSYFHSSRSPSSVSDRVWLRTGSEFETIAVLWEGQVTALSSWRGQLIIASNGPRIMKPLHDSCCANVVAYDGTAMTALAPADCGISGPVRLMAGDETKLLASWTASGHAVMAWDTGRWSLVEDSDRDNSSADALGIWEQDWVVGGADWWDWDYSQPFIRTSSEYDLLPWDYNDASTVSALLSYQGRLAFAGPKVHALDDLAAFLPEQAPSGVRALCEWQGHLVAGGSFDRLGDQPAGNVAFFDGVQWASLGAGDLNGEVRALLPMGGRLYAAGAFTHAGGVLVNGLACWDGSGWSGVGDWAGPVGYGIGIRTMAAYRGHLVVGGAFSQAGSSPAANVACWDGTNWRPLGVGVNGKVHALVARNDELWLGGEFTTAGGRISYHVAQWRDSIVPVSLAAFVAERSGRAARLHWQLRTEGLAPSLHVWRETPGAARARLTTAPISAPSAGDGEFTDPAPPPGEADYWLEELAAGGGASLWHGPAHLAAASVPAAVRLDQNRPNPFNPRTTLTLALPQAGRATLAVYDARGRRVATLLDGELPAGEREVAWDGRDGAGRAAAAGVYYVRLDTESVTRTVKITLAR